MNYISGEDRFQVKMDSIESYVDKDNEVRVIDAIIDSMDIESLGFKVGNNELIGRPTFNPKDLLKLYIYGYYNGIRSSRKLAKQCIINKEVIWLLKGVSPKYRAIADFRKDNIEAFESLFNAFVEQCINLKLYGKNLIAIDGTRFEASASKRKHYTKNKIKKMKELNAEQIKDYMKALENADKSNENDQEIQEISAKLNSLKEKKSYYESLEETLEKTGENEINLTDSDAKTVKFGAHQGTDVGFNAQVAVDSKYKLIAGFDISNSATDGGNLFPLGSKIKRQFSKKTIKVLADKGYFSLKDIKKCDENKIVTLVSKPNYKTGTGNKEYSADNFIYSKSEDSYRCPSNAILYCTTKKEDAKEKKYSNFEACSICKNKNKCTKSEKGRVLTRNEFSATKDNAIKRFSKNKKIYALRQAIVEHPFGTLKRHMNFSYLLLRNLKNVRGEISLAFFTYNLKRVIKILGIKDLLRTLIPKCFLILLNFIEETFKKRYPSII